jgi:hypothetical protein
MRLAASQSVTLIHPRTWIPLAYQKWLGFPAWEDGSFPPAETLLTESIAALGVRDIVPPAPAAPQSCGAALFQTQSMEHAAQLEIAG